MPSIPSNSLFTLIGDGCFAVIMSLGWVGYYGYHYSDPFYNSSPINWLAFLLWAFGLFITVRGHRLLKRYIQDTGYCLTVTWLIYFSGLLLIEHIGYNIIGIRQLTAEPPLVFGLIHGTPILKIYYIGAGMIAVGLSRVYENVFFKTSDKKKAHYDCRKKFN